MRFGDSGPPLFTGIPSKQAGLWTNIVIPGTRRCDIRYFAEMKPPMRHHGGRGEQAEGGAKK